MKPPYHILAAFGIATLLLTSCSKDKYEWPECEITGFITGITDSNGYITSIHDDMGHHYTVSSSRYRLGSNLIIRIIGTYTVGTDNSVTIRTLYSTNCPAGIRTVRQTDCSNDPLEIESAYLGGGYMNIALKIKTRNEEAFSRHSVEVVRLDSPDSLIFTFNHNDNGDMPVYTKKLYFSIPLADCHLQKNDTVFLTYGNYEEEDCCLNLVYR